MLDQRSEFSQATPRITQIVPGIFPACVKKSAQRRRVLVVDDETLVRWTVTEVLTAAGYEVLEARDGESAIRALIDPAGGVEVVLLDLRLPDCDDLALLKAIVRLAPGAAVILMTAFGTREIAADALRIGAFSVVAKPFDIVDLAPLVSGALASRRS
jgi:DNA-binding NtrC family response regulator